MIDVQTRIDLRRESLAELKAEYAELWDSWKVVESKAQPFAALAGVFLAGAFAYVGQLKGASTAEHVILLTIVALLIAGIVFALSAIWITDVSSPYLSSEGIDEIDDLLGASADSAELQLRRERMIQAAIKRWTGACNETRSTLVNKRQLLNHCLLTLCSAAGFCVPLVLLMIYGRTGN